MPVEKIEPLEAPAMKHRRAHGFGRKLETGAELAQVGIAVFPS